jgi:hypothetical protein
MSNWNKESLLALFKPKTILHPLPDGGQIALQELTVKEIEDARAARTAEEKAAGAGGEVTPFGLRLLVLSLVNEDGTRVLSDSDLPALRKAGNGPIESMIGKVLELNGFVKVPEKNSEATPSVASASA